MSTTAFGATSYDRALWGRVGREVAAAMAQKQSEALRTMFFGEGRRLAPRWQLPAIKRRKAGVARVYRALAEQHNANVLKCADMRWGRV